VKDYAIFILETDKLVEEALKETLQNEGYTVYSFTEPHQAFSYVSKINFQIAIMDVNTGDVCLEDFLKEIKKKTPPPAVILTVYIPESEQMIRLVNKGVNGFLIKPISMEALAEVLSKVEKEFRVYEHMEELKKENQRLREEKLSLEANLSKASLNISVVKLARIFLHELKNYLTTINLSLHNLKKQLPRQEERIDKYLEVISRSVNEANNLAMMILGLRKERREKVNVNHLLQEMVEMLDFEFRRQGIRVELSLNEEVPPVDIDSSVLKQAILNVIFNAKEAMPSGGELKIKTDCTQEELSYILIDIQDSGRGIKEEDMERIFSAGFTTKEDGSGLGLYVTKKIVEGMGGRIEVESKPHRGTKVKMFLPLKVGKVAEVK